jgi:hypothetical protein
MPLVGHLPLPTPHLFICQGLMELVDLSLSMARMHTWWSRGIVEDVGAVKMWQSEWGRGSHLIVGERFRNNVQVDERHCRVLGKDTVPLENSKGRSLPFGHCH